MRLFFARTGFFPLLLLVDKGFVSFKWVYGGQPFILVSGFPFESHYNSALVRSNIVVIRVLSIRHYLHHYSSVSIVIYFFFVFVLALGRMFETHTAELAPSVRELAEMEFKAQTSFLSLQHRDWMKH